MPIASPNENDPKDVERFIRGLQMAYVRILDVYILFSRRLKGFSMSEYYSLGLQERDYMLQIFQKEIEKEIEQQEKMEAEAKRR